MNEAKDSLQSKAVLSILDLLGEGPIGGLVGASSGKGLRSVFLNDTPIENEDGTRNFNGVTAAWRDGYNNQDVLPSFGNYVEAPFNLNLAVKAATPYTFTVSNPNADAVRVIVNFPALSTTNSENGDITAATAQYKFSMSTNGGPFVDQVLDTIYPQNATWATEAGYLTATAAAGATGVRASVTASGSPRYEYYNYGGDNSGYSMIYPNGSITVQAQEFNGSTWQNLGSPKALAVTWSSYVENSEAGSTIYAVSGDTYRVESNFSKVRFLITAKTDADMRVDASAAYSRTGTSTITVSGKSRSRYQRSHVIRIPQPNSDVRIRMTRITPDSTTAFLANETYIDSYAEIVTLNMAYPNSAIFGMRVDSQQFNQLPSRSYLVDGLMIRVPTNYDPVTRIYTGIWNGTFKYAVSNNPAWIMFDVLTNARYGLGNFISDTQVDKAALYTIGRYCDELVPNGFGGSEPRFTLNTVIASQAEAFKLISDIASVFRGMSFWDGGMVNFTQDAPTDPTMIYTSANVIEGIFNYTGSARKDRHSVVHVTWNDPENNYKKKVEYVEDKELVSLYGIKKLDTLAFGCTSRGQAVRVGKWILYTEKFESDFVTFKVGVDSAFVQPGNIIKIHDSNRAGRRAGGRISACTTTSATLDNEATITGASTLSIMMPDGTFADRTLNETTGTHTTVTWNTPLTELPVDNALWMLSETSLVPVLARVISVAQGDRPSEFEITALEHNPSKFSAIEQGFTLQDRKTSIIDASFVQTPTQLTVTEARYKAAPGVFANKLLIFWHGDSTQYDLSYRGVGPANASNWINTRVADGLSYEVLNVATGPYEVSIVGINPLGKRSTSATATYTVVGKVKPPSNVIDFAATPNEQGVQLGWSPLADEDLKAYELRACSVPGQAWESATKLIETTSTVYQVPPMAAGLYQWLVKAIDTTGNYSAQATRVSVTLVAPGVVTPTATYSRADLIVAWMAATAGSLPIKNYIIKRGGTWESAALVGTTTDTSYKTPVTWASAQVIWVAAVDMAGSVGTPTSVNVAFAAPTAPVVTSAKKATSFTLDWSTPSSTLPIASYEVRFGSTFANGVTIGSISGNQLTIPITWLGSRTFWVAAIDLNGNTGISGSHALTVTAPRAPSGFAVAYDRDQATISWADAAETLPVDFYEIRRGAQWETGTLVGKAYTTALTLAVTWTESATFTVRATDVNGNIGPIGTYVNGLTAPGAVSVAHQFKDGNAILTWASPASGSLPIRQYEIREGATWATGSVVGVTSDRLYSIPVNWTSSKTFHVAAIDTAGNVGASGSRAVTYTDYDAPGALSATLAQANLTLTWQAATGGSLDIAYYDIRFGADWETGEVIGKANTTTITLPVTWLGSRQLWVTAVDTNKQYGAPASITSTIAAPGTPSVSSAVVVAKAELTWTAPSATLPIKEYEIRQGASFAAGTLVTTTLSTSFRAPIDWLGSRTYWIAARDVNGNVGTAGSTVVNITAPAAPNVSGVFVLDEFKLSWTEPASTLPNAEYEIRHGASWAAGTVLGRVKGTTISTKAQWLGSRTWWVAAIDVNGNVGAAGSAALTITAPSKPTLTQQVVDNNVLLYWSQPTGTLPVVTNELRRGATWETATSIGQKAGGFTTVFETVAGTYTYWVAGVDSAGNVGTPGEVTTSVNQPPDYALKANNDLTFAGTKSNMALDTDGTYILPVNTTETFEQHFEQNILSNPDTLWDGTSWTLPGFFATTQSTAVADPYGKSAPVARFVSNAGASALFLRKTQSFAVATYSESIYVYVPAQAGVTDWKIGCDFTDIETSGFSAPSTTFNQWVRVTLPLVTTAATRSWLDFNIFVNGTTLPASGFTFYATGARAKIGSSAWMTPDAQIAAGYPVYIQPSSGSGYYEEVIDYGTAIGGTKVTVTPTGSIVAGAPVVTTDISVKLNAGDAWMDYPDTTSVFVNNFRYIKVRFTVTGDSLSLYRLANLNVKLDTKVRNEAGMGVADATDAVSGTSAVINGVSQTGVNPNNGFGVRVPDGAGTLVRFATPFVDIQAVEISLAVGSTARYGLYDFVDVPNAAGFKVTLYDAAGARVGGSFSWSVKGY